MYLDTLKDADLLERQRKKRDVARELPTNLFIGDIFQAAPFYSHRQFFHEKPPVKESVPKGAPKTHYPSRGRAVDFSLISGDIEKAQPNSIAFNTSRRTDPLVPNY